MRRDNHYVSRGYLKRWTVDGSRVWTYRVVVPHQASQVWRLTSTKGVAYHKHLYTKIAASGENDELERWLETEFETPAEEAIDRAVNDRRLTPTHWGRLARFFAAQDVRTPARLQEQMERWSATLPQQIEDSLKETVAELSAMTPEQRKALPKPTETDVPFRVTIERRPGEPGGWVKGETVSGRGLWLWSIKQLLTGAALAALMRHRWTILTPPNGLTWFTSDDPVLKLNFNSVTDYTFGGGWGSVGTDLLLPLGPRHLLHTQIGKPVAPRGTTLELEKAVLVRRLLAERAHRFVFSSEPDPFVEAVRRRLVDSDAVRHEAAEWRRWHSEQTAAEKRLMGLADKGEQTQRVP